jgi:hypothetical protein
MRYFEDEDTGRPLLEPYPVEYSRTVTDTTVRPHWAYEQLGIDRIEESAGNTTVANQDLRMGVVTSEAPGGANPYPDLHFDPMSWPDGVRQRGFGFYDYGVDPDEDVAEVLYTRDNTGISVGTRKLIAPGVNGNVIYLSFHPYFVERLEFRQFVRAALDDFGEVPAP